MSVFRDEDGQLAAEVNNPEFCNDLNQRTNHELIKELNAVLLNKKLAIVDVLANISYILADTIASENMTDESVCILAQDVNEYVHTTAHLIHEAKKPPRKKHS